MWNPVNGANAKISVSADGCNWESIGSLPSTFGKQIQKLKLQRQTKCKFIRFNHTSYLGIGYLKVNVDDRRDSVNLNNISISISGQHPFFSSFSYSGPYSFLGRVAGTNELINVTNRSLTQGNYFT